jgi:hypothetical protein
MDYRWTETRMTFTKYAAALLAAAFMAGAGAQTVQSTSNPDDSEIEVTGTGETPEAARTDAIRQALQQVVPQVVAAERYIENDNVVMDHVLSSMNGHVKSVQTLDVKKTDIGYSTRIRATISKHEIANFIRYRADSKVAFSGEAVLAEANREIEARNFRGEFLEHLFRGYPSEYVTTKIQKIEPDAANPGTVRMQISYQLRPDFVEGLRRGVSEIQCQPDQKSCSNQSLCFEQASGVSCVRLAAGPLLAAGHLNGNYPILRRLFPDSEGDGRSSFIPGLLIRFLNAAGQRVGSKECFDVGHITDNLKSGMIELLPIHEGEAERRIHKETNNQYLGGNTRWISDRPMADSFDFKTQLIRGSVEFDKAVRADSVAVLFDRSNPHAGVRDHGSIVFDVTNTRQPAVKPTIRHADNDSSTTELAAGCPWPN